METADPKAPVLRWYEAWNRHELEAVDEVAAEDFLLHFETLPEVRGREAYKQVVRGFWDAFPDLTVTPEVALADGDRVFVRSRLEGTHQGPFLGVPPTGKRAVWRFHNLYRIAGGRIAEAWAFPDALGLLQQLGAIPSHS